ncbi:hypothetical protein, partial [Comamonas sp. 4034]|uniref:hypothetical protein n=1 Tax=Comamonas sp. 4034 TaxID=3156455 RepID=UPI003D1AF0D2
DQDIPWLSQPCRIPGEPWTCGVNQSKFLSASPPPNVQVAWNLSFKPAQFLVIPPAPQQFADIWSANHCAVHVGDHHMANGTEQMQFASPCFGQYLLALRQPVVLSGHRLDQLIGDSIASSLL